jgi:MFS family permease
VLTALAAASLTYSMMQSLVVPALPAIQRELHASADATSWTVAGFLLSSAVATPIAGRLGDLLGKRRVLVTILVIVAAGSALCVIPTLPALIGGRVIQGVSGGVLPLAYAIVRDELPAERTSRGIALVATMLGLGGGLGIILAALIVEWLSYTWIFWLQVPAFAAVAWGVHRHVPDSGPRVADARIDWLGAALLATGLVALLVTITQVRRWGAASVTTAGVIAIGVVALALWARSALRRADPLLDLRMMRRRPIWSTNAAAVLVGVAQFSGFVLIPQYVQDPGGFDAGPLVSGLFLLPMCAGILAVGVATGSLEPRYGGRALLLGAGAALAASMLMLAFARGGALEVCTASLLSGVGAGAGMAALATLIVTHVDVEETGAASGVNNVARTLGAAVGTQIGAALLVTGASGYTLAFGVGLAASVGILALGPLLPARLEEPTAAVAAAAGGGG